MVPAVKHRPRLVPELPAHEGLVAALVGLAIPDELAHVDRVAHRLVHTALHHRLASGARHDQVASSTEKRAVLFLRRKGV
jgi:hypothetical protein